jgi:hypothetical protein
MPFNSVDELRAQIERLLPFVAPVLVYPRADVGVQEWLTGGSALFVSSGQNRFLITADHFVREIENIREQREIVVLLGGASAAPIDISNWTFLAKDASIDICTIQIPPEFNAEELNKSFLAIDQWPRPLARKGDHILIIGYPAAHRQGHEMTINARILPISDFVTDVGPRRFTVADEKDEREILINPDRLTFPTHLGGMSGSPVFDVSNTTHAEFIGVFSEGSDGLRGAYFCSHAIFLLPSGRLDLAKIPPR